MAQRCNLMSGKFVGSYQELCSTISSLHFAIDTRYWYQLNLMEKTQCLQQYNGNLKSGGHVQILNGQKEVGWQMAWILSGI